MSADVHDLTSMNHEHSTNGGSHNKVDSDTPDNCDHCCHGAAHLLGLSQAVLHTFVDYRSVEQAAYLMSLISFSPPSFLRPPISV